MAVRPPLAIPAERAGASETFPAGGAETAEVATRRFARHRSSRCAWSSERQMVDSGGGRSRQPEIAAQLEGGSAVRQDLLLPSCAS